MATDKSEPKIGLIFGIAIVVVGSVIGVRAALTSYFDSEVRDEVHRKLGAPESLENLRASERERLTAGPMPIATAMQHMVTQGRVAVSPEIAASASRDTAPLSGWTKLPADVPSAMTAPAAPEVAASAPADAGVKRADAGPAPPDGGPARKVRVKRQP